jgi:Ca-activated chloride channel family protein
MAVNGSFGFSNPWILIALVVFIPFAIYDFSGRLAKRERSLSGELRRKIRASVIFFRIFTACIIIALAGPRWGTAAESGERRRGLDAVFAIDVSRSMDLRDAAADTGLSRLELGLSIAREAVLAFSGPRYAAAIGKSRGIVTVPLTWDNEAVLNFLESVDSSSLTGGGTNLESLVAAASGALQGSFSARQVIILISDGEALSGSFKDAVDRCAKDGIIIIALAMGSDEGRTVPEENVTSRRETAVMRMAAERTGGFYIDGSAEDSSRILADHLFSLAPETTGGHSSRSVPKDRRFMFIIIAIMAYGISKIAPLLPER